MDSFTQPQPGVLEWLLEPKDPSICFWTLQHIQNLPLTNPAVLAAQGAITHSPVVQRILTAQQTEGYWGNPNNVYIKKYTATTHSLLILAELGMKLIPPIERAIQHLFAFQLDSGHFSTLLPKTARGRASAVSDMCCFDANILYYLIHFGYLESPHVQNLIRFLLDHHDEKNGGWVCRAYPINPTGVFPKNCYMGLCKMLRSFSVIPSKDRSPQMRAIIRQVSEIILENYIYKYLRAQDGSRKEKAGWKRFGFPLFYNSDALEVLETLLRLDIRDPRMQDAIDLVLKNQQADGKWLLQHSFNGKMWHDIEVKGKPSKWITLRALKVLRSYYNK